MIELNVNWEDTLKTGVICPSVGTKGASFRFNYDSIFSNADIGIYQTDLSKNIDIYSLLGYLNSKLILYINNMLNPTVNTMPNDIKRIPFNQFSSTDEYILGFFSKRCIEIKSFLNYENHLLAQVLINEAIINEKIFEVYNLTPNDKAMVLAKEGESIGGLPVLEEARIAYLAEKEATAEFPLDNVVDFINSLPTKKFSIDEIEKITAEFPKLYQSNNDLEEFCIRYKVNPINVWYWFKESGVIPQQRMNTLAMEFLVDMVREMLMEDADGIVPLVSGAGQKTMQKRIEEKFIEKSFTTAQHAGFSDVLGRPINDYINRYFFAELSDHLNLFMYLPKTPFIWHLSSGPAQGFDCYIIIYKWSRDKLMLLKARYLENRTMSLINRQSDLSDNNSIEAQKEKEWIFNQLKEIEGFQAKIDELLAEGYNPILDDGAGKNIAPLQRKKMIPYEVLNEGQLRKYLNADW